MADQYANQDREDTLYRASLRRTKIAAREVVPVADRSRACEFINSHLMALFAHGLPRTIAFCSPVRGEVDCRPLVDRLVASGWRACQPVVVEPTAPMVFRHWTPESEMTTGNYGIPIPAAGELLVPDVVLLPVVAFDNQGYRLGYGGGYFDRTLAVLTPRPLAVGVGFESACVDSIRPLAHDIRLDFIVTDACIHRPIP